MRTSTEGIKLLDQIKAQRLLIVKRTPGMFARYYACNQPHENAYTFIITSGWTGGDEIIEMWERGEKLAHWILEEDENWDTHPEIVKWSELCFPQRVMPKGSMLP